MLKKILLVLIISIFMLSISGCTDEVVEEIPENTDLTNTISADVSSQSLVPMDNLPESYEFLGSRDLSVGHIEYEYVPVEGIVAGLEGLYMYLNSTDVYVDVIELNSSISAEDFIVQYKADFKELSTGQRFTEVSINGHSAIRILKYSGASNSPRYTYIWSNGKFVFVVGGATDDSDVLLTLAESTGY
jgi:hypothetical protein